MRSKREIEDSKFQAGATIVRLSKLKELNYLQNPENTKNEFYKSVFMEFVIELDYLLNLPIFKRVIRKINFNDDIPQFKNDLVGKYDDILSLIKFLRNTLCHATDYKKRYNAKTDQYLAYTFRTYKDFAYSMEGFDQCPYPEEIAVVFGEHVIFINRHIMRIFIDLCNHVLELPDFVAYKNWVK